MTGTEKQIKFAEDIKAKFNAEMEAKFAEYDKQFAKLPAEKQIAVKPILDQKKAIVTQINNKEDAKFWINNKTSFFTLYIVEQIENGEIKL